MIGSTLGLAAVLSLCGIQSGNAAASEPSLNETIEWITDKLEKYGNANINDGARAYIFGSRRVARLSPCVLEITWRILSATVDSTCQINWDTTPPGPLSGTLTLDFRDRSPNDIRVASSMTIPCNPALTVEQINLAPAVGSNAPQMTLWVFNGGDVSERMVKALKRATALCGGREEAF